MTNQVPILPLPTSPMIEHVTGLAATETRMPPHQDFSSSQLWEFLDILTRTLPCLSPFSVKSTPMPSNAMPCRKHPHMLGPQMLTYLGFCPGQQEHQIPKQVYPMASRRLSSHPKSFVEHWTLSFPPSPRWPRNKDNPQIKYNHRPTLHQPLAASSSSETVTTLYPLFLNSGSTRRSMGIVQLRRS